jgi:hypothetical protein
MRSRRLSFLDWLLPLGFLIAAVAVLWHGLLTVPQQYEDLARRGVPVPVQITECGRGVGGDSRGYGCRLQTDYHGHVHRWRLDRDVRAETGQGGLADGLVDPLHPSRSALAVDVEHRSRVPGDAMVTAGFFAVVALGTAAAAFWTRRDPSTGTYLRS